MRDPMFIRRGSDGKVVKAEELMTPSEVLLNKRILQITRNIAYTYQDTQPRGVTDIISEALLCLDDMSHEPIKLIISSPGGAVHATHSLCDAIKSIKSPVWTFGRSCLSSGALVLASGEPGHRYVYPSTYAMLHLIHVTREGSVDSKTEEIQAVQLRREIDRMTALLIEAGVNKTAKQIEEEIDRELWLNAWETVEWGLADHVIKGGGLLDDEVVLYQC